MSNGKFEKGRFTTIPETRNIKLPIGGKIRLGIKVKNEEGIEYPKETNYFVCPDEVKKIYGEEPTELIVFFPTANREEIFPQCYEKYGSNNALLCQGDGDISKTAQRLNLENGRWEEVKCPCENYNKKYDKTTKIGGCVKAGYLKFMMPSVSIGTFYQCRVGGTVSTEECNSAFEVARKTTGGCWAMIPFRMKRVLKKLKIPGTAKMKDHWVVTLEIAASIEEIRRVSAGEILYLGQQKNGHYELEPSGLPLENRAYVPLSTEEEKLEQEKKEAESQEKAKVEYHQSKLNEEKLKVEHEEGKGKIKSCRESKTIYKKKKEEGEKIEAELNSKDLEEVTEILKTADIINWNQALYYARQSNIKVSTIPELKKMLTENIGLVNRLIDARMIPNKKHIGSIEKHFEKLKELNKALEYKEGEQEITDEGNFP